MSDRIPLIAGNWKMNLNLMGAASLVKSIRDHIGDLTGIDVLVAPPFTTLPVVKGVIGDAKILLGAQNMHWEAEDSSPLILYVDGRGKYGIPLVNRSSVQHLAKNGMSAEVRLLYTTILKSDTPVEKVERSGNRVFIWLRRQTKQNTKPIELRP